MLWLGAFMIIVLSGQVWCLPLLFIFFFIVMANKKIN